MQEKKKKEHPRTSKKQPPAQPATAGRQTGTPQRTATLRPANERWFRTIVEMTPDAVFIFDNTGRVHYWNDGATRMFGYTKEEMIGNSAYLLIPERFRKRNATALDKLLADSSPGQFGRTVETYCLKKDGSEIFVEYSNAVWKKGRAFFIGSIIRDISQRRQAEEALKQSREQLEDLVLERTAELSRTNTKLEQEVQKHREAEELLRRSENQYRAVFENTGTAMILFGEDTIITMANAEAEKLSGYARGDIEGKKSWTEFVCPADLEQMKQFHLKRGQDPVTAPRNYEYRLVDRFGHIKEIYQTVTVIPGTKLRVSSLVDVTDRKRAEEELRKTEEMLNTAFMQSPSGILLADAPDVHIRMANPAALGIRGGSDKPLTDIDVAEHSRNWQTFYPDGRSYASEDLPLSRAILTGEVVRNEEAIIRRSDGEDRWVSANAAPIYDAQGAITAGIVVFHDITDRKQAEEERIRLTSIIESTNDLVATAKLDYSLMYMNRAGRRMLGWNEDGPLTGKSITDVHPGWAQQIILAQAVPAALRDGLWSGETAIIGRNGREIPVSHVIMAHSTAHGEARFFSAVIRDVSAFKKAELAIRESEERHRSVVETATDAIITVNSSGVIISWNKGAELLYGYAKDAAIGRSYTCIIPARFQDMQERILARVLRGETTLTSVVGEGIGRRSDGSEFPIETSIATWKAGGERFFTAIMRDITERKRTDAERMRLMTAIEQAAESIIIMSPEGTVLYANPATALQSGYSLDALIGRNPFEPQAEGYDKAYFRTIFDALHQGKTWTGRLAFRKKDGSLIELEQTLSPIQNASGHIINLLSISRDISKEVKLEEQLRQSQKMEAIGTLAGGIAHDFNNILAAIMGYTEMSLYQTPDESPMKQNLSLVLKSAMRARDLVRQILAFSRKSQEERKPCHMHVLVREAIKLLRASIPATIAIREHIDDAAGIVMADPTQIHQVIVNLCTNAAQAMQEKGGCLTIALAPVALTPDDVKTFADLSPGAYLQLDVTDTGTGIDPQILGRIFDPFFTTKEVGKGTGMGLAVVHGIVKNYRGAISVQSEPGTGTSFRVLLPCISEAAREEQEEASPLPGGSERILFVDDEELLVQISREMLETLGYSVVALQNSVQALDLFEHDPQGFDLVITDQAMPQINGYELAQRIIGLRPDVPIMLCTGYSETVSEEQALAAGIRGFVMKPIKLQDFAQRIRAVLDRGAIPRNAGSAHTH